MQATPVIWPRKLENADPAEQLEALGEGLKWEEDERPPEGRARAPPAAVHPRQLRLKGRPELRKSGSGGTIDCGQRLARLKRG